VPGIATLGAVKEKKTLAASEQDPEASAAWRQAVTMLDPKKLVFIDEAGSHTAMTRTHARAPKGQRAYGSVPRNRGGNLTLLAALSNTRIQAEWVIEGSVDGDVFVTWLEQVLLPLLTQARLWLWTTSARTSARKCVRLSKHAAAACSTCHPYSPDFSPIELAFSKIKGHLKSLAARSKQALTDAVAEACRTVSSADVAGWFRHCGYNLQ
jgi:transposase